jgi:hypothetical protein
MMLKSHSSLHLWLSDDGMLIHKDSVTITVTTIYLWLRYNHHFFTFFVVSLSEDLKTAAMQFMRSRMNEIVRQPNFTSLPKDVMVDIIQHMTEKMSLSE